MLDRVLADNQPTEGDLQGGNVEHRLWMHNVDSKAMQHRVTWQELLRKEVLLQGALTPLQEAG